MAHLAQPLWFSCILAWLFCVMLASAFAVVRHAESLAVIFGEPSGTLILTLSAITIEVMMISAVMLTGDSKPAVARDTMFAVLMIILNGMVGLSLLLGGLRHHEQTYNFYGANAFLELIVPLAVLALVLPNYTTASAGPTLSPFQSGFSAIMCVGLYGIFMASQTSRYREYFIAPGAQQRTPHRESGIITRVWRGAPRPIMACCWCCICYRSRCWPNSSPSLLIMASASLARRRH